MPEGHLVHHLARRQTLLLAGGAVEVTSPQGRFAQEAALLDGRVLTDVEAFGKHLFYWFEGNRLVHVHLGMRGTVLLRSSRAAPIPQARVRFLRQAAAVDIVAPIVCELGDEDLRARVVARLGPDLLRDDVTPADVKARLRGKRAAIGAVLLDQAGLSGVGNVLRAEALHAARIHPARPATSLSSDEVDRLVHHLLLLMRRGAELGRILPYLADDEDASAVEESATRAVYRRDTCRVCGTGVEHPSVGGRDAWACPRCQPRGDTRPHAPS